MPLEPSELALTRAAATLQAANRTTELLEPLEALPTDQLNPEVAPSLAAARAAIANAATAAVEAATKAQAAETSQEIASAKSSTETAKNQLSDAQNALTLVAATDISSSSAVQAVSQTSAALATASSAVDVAATATASAERRSKLNSIRLKSSLVIVGGAALAIGLWVRYGHPSVGLWSSIVFASGVVVAALLTLLFLGGEHGLLRPVMGSDNRVSTSKTQLGAWTVAVAFGIAFLVGRVFWDGANLDEVLKSDQVDQYLLLIGGPFAATVLAKLAVSWKVQNGTVQKTVATSDPELSQVLQNDGGQADLVDSQYLIFNFVALAYFVVRLAIEKTLPEIPAVLLGLTSASAATYVANKAVEKNPPIITSVTPASFRPGQTVHIGGQNFWSEGEAVSVKVVVSIADFPTEIHPTPLSSPAELEIQAPLGLPTGDKKLTVTTPAHVTSAPYIVRILEEGPALLETPRGSVATSGGAEPGTSSGMGATSTGATAATSATPATSPGG